ENNSRHIASLRLTRLIFCIARSSDEPGDAFSGLAREAEERRGVTAYEGMRENRARLLRPFPRETGEGQDGGDEEEQAWTCRYAVPSHTRGRTTQRSGSDERLGEAGYEA
ncbi:MAG TPA: hypothetical protein VF161_12245, partial [Steroidobacteraceae bacterium]